ncbi:MAG: hypothetical protein RLZ41_588 [Actinomycetota bacterium]
MRRLIRLGLPNTRNFYLGLFISLLQAVSAVALLATSAWLISRASEQPPVMYLMIAVLGVRGFALGRAAFRYGERILLHDAAFKMLANTRPRIFEKLIPLSPAGLGDSSHGQIMSKLVADVDELQNLPLRVIAPIFQSFTVSILTVLGLALLLPSAAVSLFLALLATFLIAMPLSGLVSRSADRERAGIAANLASQSLDLLEHLDVLKAYGWLSVRAEQLSETDKILQAITKKKSLSIGVGQSLFSFFATAATIATAYFGAVSVANQEHPGVLLALFALIPMAIFDVLLNAQPALSSWRTYKASAKRILEMQDKKIPKILVPRFGETDIAKFKELSLSRVSIGYPDQVPVLKDLSFELKAGETLLLNGNSGSGKSTIALALLRFLDIQSGTYELNGRPVTEYSVDSVRRIFGMVEQQPAIFMGNVRDNLLIANPKATDEDLNQVLARVGLAETFDNRDGLETNLGERGVLISGGEAQRLALARALLANFGVLILDEPTANVDEGRAQDLLEDLLSAARQDASSAIILITHDTSLGKLADRVIGI